MAKRAPPHAWKDGQSGNPNGRPRLPDSLARLKDHSKLLVIQAIAETMLMTRDQLKERTANPNATMAELLVGAIMVKAIEHGDPVRAQCLFNYVVGKPEPYQPIEPVSDAEKIAENLNMIPSNVLIQVLQTYNTTSELQHAVASGGPESAS